MIGLQRGFARLATAGRGVAGAHRYGGAVVAARSATVGRIGVGEDIARVVAFLADPASDYITGESVMVTGGDLMI